MVMSPINFITPPKRPAKEPPLDVVLQQVWLAALLTTLSQLLMALALSGAAGSTNFWWPRSIASSWFR